MIKQINLKQLYDFANLIVHIYVRMKVIINAREHIKIVKTNPMLYFVDHGIIFEETRLSGYTLEREKSGRKWL